MTVPTLHGESADAYAARVLTTWRDGYRDPHAAHRVVLVIVTEERRSALAMARGLDAALTDDQARRLLTRTVAPALVDSRPGPALVHAVAQILLALGAEPADVAEPYRTRTDWRFALRSLLQIVGLFGFLTGMIVYVLRADARAKRERALEAAGLIPPGTAFQGPFTEPGPPIDLDVGRRTIVLAGGIPCALLTVFGGTVGPRGLIVLAVAIASTWTPLALRYRGWLRPAPAQRMDGAWRVRSGTVVARRVTVLLAPGAVLSAAVIATDLASAAALLLLIALLAAMSAASQRELRIFDWGIEWTSPVLRAGRRIPWEEVSGVVILNWRGAWISIKSARGEREGVALPIESDGIAELAATLLRRVRPGVLDAAPDVRRELEMLAAAASSELPA